MTVRTVAGCMTGTSIDALDVAIVRLEGSGLGMRARIEGTGSVSLGELAQPLRAIAEQQSATAGTICEIGHALSLLHARAVSEVAGDTPIDFVAVHGQTIVHRPPISWQLINPTVIAHQLAVPVVSDLRAADLAAGGQGAPITPLADWILFRSAEEARVVANLGGFCNITLLPRDTGDGGAPSHVTGRDICPCNHLLDRIARRCFDAPYDADGAHALEGRRNDSALTDLVARLFDLVKGDRSLGTGDELDTWIDESLANVKPNDLAATACVGIAVALSHSHPGVPTHLLLAGGGTHNLALLDGIRDQWAGPVSYTDQFDVPAQHREAAAMACLGALCQDRVPITLPAVTKVDAPAPIAGVWVL